MSPQVLLILAAASSVLAQDTFLESARAACLRHGHLLPCAKYKIANLVHRIASTQRSMDLGPLRLVSIPRGNSSQDDSLMARAADFAPQEPELLKMFKYGVRQLDLFLTSHGLSLPLASIGGVGPYVVHDDGTSTNTVDARGIHSKKKLALLFPLLVLLKFGIIKAFLVPILLGVLFIKKIIVLGVMALPSILSTIKACKIVSPYHAAYHSSVYQPMVEEYGHDVTSYGSQGYGHGGYDSYGKDWGANQQRATDGEVQAEGRGRNLHIIVPLMIMVKLMSIKALLIPTLLGVAAIKKFIILTVMLLPSILHKLKACKIVPHLVHYTPHHSHSHEFHDDYLPHHDHHELHDHHDHHEAFHQGDIHRRLAHYRSIKV